MSVLASVTTHRELVGNLVLRDIRSRYKQSVLGYAWGVLNPFILALVFSTVARFLGQESAGDFPFLLHSYFGVLLWSLFATGLGAATEGLVAHISLITKVYFPREVFPVSAVVSKLADFGFGLAGLAALIIYFSFVPEYGLARVAPGWSIILVIPLIAIQLCLTAGLGMLAACANLFYRDVRYLVQLALGILVYFVPNIYTLDRVQKTPDAYRIYMLNPMATLIEAARRLAFPQTGPIEPLVPYLIWATCFSLGILFVGYRVFKAYEPRFAEFV